MPTPDPPPRPPLSVRSTKPDQDRTPDLQQVNSIVLDQGPRSRKELIHFAIRSRNTGESKGNRIGFRTKHRIQGTWQNDPAKSFTLETDEQIRAAVQFILAACERNIPDIGGHFLVVPAPHDGDVVGLQRVLNALSKDGKADLLVDLLGQASRAPDLMQSLMDHAARNPTLFMEAAAALKLSYYRQAVRELEHLIATSNRENDFQQLLSKDPWMFGSEYSEQLSRRNFTRDAQQDFVLRRTADGYIEIVEIKTPLNGRELFRFDPSRQSHYAGADLSAAVGQAEKYIEELDASRYEISARDGEDTAKIRAKIIIGRDGDIGQQQALRRFNGHLHRIEVFSFDQLLRIAQRVVGYLEEFVPPQSAKLASDVEDEIPF